LQLNVVTAADQIQVDAVALTTAAGALAGSADALAGAGSDVSTVTAPLTDLADHVDAATSAAQAAVTTVLAIPAAPTPTELSTGAKTAQGKLTDAKAALSVARNDLTVAGDALTALQASVSRTP
jgi:hypothetical protein